MRLTLTILVTLAWLTGTGCTKDTYSQSSKGAPDGALNAFIYGDIGSRSFDGQADIETHRDTDFKYQSLTIYRTENDSSFGMLVVTLYGITLDAYGVGLHTLDRELGVPEQSLTAIVCSGESRTNIDYDAMSDTVYLTVSEINNGMHYEITTLTAMSNDGNLEVMSGSFDVHGPLPTYRR